jgi:signal transduction histidine kinase/PAS domain-containing protein
LTDPVISPYSGAFELGNTGMLEVVDATGQILMSTRPGRVMNKYDEGDTIMELFAQGLPSVETCLGCSEDLTGSSEDEVIAFAPVSRAPWGVTIRQEASEVFAPVRNLTYQVLALSLFAVAGAIVLVWLTTNSVIAPVQALTAAVQRIGKGDLKSPVQPLERSFLRGRKRHDEIGQLAENFDVMRLQLKGLIDEISSLNKDLDRRVQERSQAAVTAQLEAQAARDDLKAVIDALDDSLVVIDVENRTILQTNRASQQVCSDPGVLIGEKCYDILPADRTCGDAHDDCPITNVLATGGSVKLTQHHKCPYSDRSRYFDVVASPMFDAGGKITRIVELRRDVTEDRQVRQALLRRNQQLAMLNAVANTVNQTLDLEDILQRALDQLIHLTSIDAGAVFLRDGMALKMMAYKGLSKQAARLAAEVGLLDGSCGGVLETGEITIVPDLSQFRGHRARSLQKEKLSTLVHIPLVNKGCTLGSMCIGTRMQRSFDEEERQLLSALGNQIAVAIENARLYAEVQHKEHIRGELFIKAINAQEEERRRIARELHDETSQSLAALLFAIEEAQEMKSVRAINSRLVSMRELTKRMLDDIHKIIFDLRPSMLDHLGLVPALRWLAESRLSPKGVRVVVEEVTPSRRLPAEMETAIFRVVQEAITNIARHAAARNACILFNLSDEQVTISVDDDGIGFNVETLGIEADDMRGLGLLSMRERLELLGGELDISSAPGQGTQIIIKLKLQSQQGAVS